MRATQALKREVLLRGVLRARGGADFHNVRDEASYLGQNNVKQPASTADAFAVPTRFRFRTRSGSGPLSPSVRRPRHRSLGSGAPRWRSLDR